MTEVSGTPSRKCSLCDDTGSKDYAGFAMDACDHDTADLVARLSTATMSNGRTMSSGEMAAAMRKAAATITRLDASAEERPTAQDYRNRAERAEAECAELREKLREHLGKGSIIRLQDRNIAQLEADLAAERDKDARELSLDLIASECLQDGAYKAGLKAGWNFAQDDDHEGLHKAMGGTEHIAELNRIRSERGERGPNLNGPK